MLRPILTITGSDSTGGAGIQADLRIMAGLGAEAMSVVTSITLQNSLGIQEFYDIPAPIIERQIDAVADDAAPQVVKIGMIRNTASLHAIVGCLKRHKPEWVLYSPVVYSVHQQRLMDDSLIDLVQQELLPLCSLLVVRKGDAGYFDAPRSIEADGSHGRSNELCSAIAAFLNRGSTLDEAIRKAQLLVPAHEDDNRLSGRAAELYRQFLAMQERYCSHDHDVNYYSQQLDVSPRYLAQVTRRMANTTPKAIIEASLLLRIKELLKTQPSMPLQDIADELHFSSQAHLSHLFKRLVGITMSEYRKKAITR